MEESADSGSSAAPVGSSGAVLTAELLPLDEQHRIVGKLLQQSDPEQFCKILKSAVCTEPMVIARFLSGEVAEVPRRGTVQQIKSALLNTQEATLPTATEGKHHTLHLMSSGVEFADYTHGMLLLEPFWVGNLSGRAGAVLGAYWAVLARREAAKARTPKSKKKHWKMHDVCLLGPSWVVRRRYTVRSNLGAQLVTIQMQSRTQAFRRQFGSNCFGSSSLSRQSMYAVVWHEGGKRKVVKGCFYGSRADADRRFNDLKRGPRTSVTLFDLSGRLLDTSSYHHGPKHAIFDRMKQWLHHEVVGQTGLAERADGVGSGTTTPHSTRSKSLGRCTAQENVAQSDYSREAAAADAAETELNPAPSIRFESDAFASQDSTSAAAAGGPEPDALVCQGCAHRNPSEANFCNKCGKSLQHPLCEESGTQKLCMIRPLAFWKFRKLKEIDGMLELAEMLEKDDMLELADMLENLLISLATCCSSMLSNTRNTFCNVLAHTLAAGRLTCLPRELRKPKIRHSGVAYVVLCRDSA